MDINIKTKLSSTEGTVVNLDKKALAFFKEDKVTVINEGVTVIEFDVVDFTKSRLMIDLKVLMGNKIFAGGNLTIGQK